MPHTESSVKARKRDGHIPEHRSDSQQHRTLSCSECRRLKLKCDRNWPCQSCVKRGCASICPNGSLTPGGGGNRFILHGSEQLHSKIKEMSERIGQLEDAIACMWNSRVGARDKNADGSDEPGLGAGEHPLLRPELLKIKLLPDTQNASGPISTPQKKTDEEEDKGCNEETDGDCITAELGMLTLDDRGKGSYMGRTARVEFILKSGLQADQPAAASTSSGDPGSPEDTPANQQDTATGVAETFQDSQASSPSLASLPAPIRHIAQSFLISTPPYPECTVTIEELKSYLPPLTRAWALCETYFEHAGWFYSPIGREEFIRDVLSVIYTNLNATTNAAAAQHSSPAGSSSHDSPAPSSLHESSTSEDPSSIGPHDIALLFMIFAVGAIADLTMQPFNAESEFYHALAKVAVCLETPWDGSSVSLIAVLNLMVYYSVQWNQKTVEVEGVWAIMGLTSKFATSMGLHRDSARWNLSPKEVQKRRRVFWEVFTMDSWQSLGYGRPPSLSLRYVDCKIPNDPEEKRDSTGKVTLRSFQQYKYAFVRDCIQPVIEHTFTVKPFTYQTVGLLDKKVRAFDFGDLASELGPNPSVASLMQRHILLCMREFTLLYIHRSFFTRVMIESPNAPLESPYASSVLATFRCAVTLLQIVKTCYNKHPALVARFALPWTYVLTSAVVTASICFRGPKSSLAPAAYYQLCIVGEMFDNLRKHNPRAERVMPILCRLQRKAHNALMEVAPGPASQLPVPPDRCPLNPPPLEGSVDELEAYGGKARVIRREGPHHHHHNQQQHSSPLSQQSDMQIRGSASPVPTVAQIAAMNAVASSPSPPPDTAGGWQQPPNSAITDEHGSFDFAGFMSSAQSMPSPGQFTSSTGSSQVASPYLQFTQEAINPSSIPTAIIPATENPLSGVQPGSASGPNEDLSWLDGFGVGAPMDQYPMIGHQTAIFSDVEPTSAVSSTGFTVNEPNVGDYSWMAAQTSSGGVGGEAVPRMTQGFSNQAWGGSAGMAMSVDNAAGGGLVNGSGEAISVEPALDDAAWQQYMQRLFTNGVPTAAVV